MLISASQTWQSWNALLSHCILKGCIASLSCNLCQFLPFRRHPLFSLSLSPSAHDLTLHETPPKDLEAPEDEARTPLGGGGREKGDDNASGQRLGKYCTLYMCMHALECKNQIKAFGTTEERAENRRIFLFVTFRGESLAATKTYDLSKVMAQDVASIH